VQRFVSLYPYGAWRPGGVITGEMHRQTEALLPLREMIPPIRRVVQGLLLPPPDGFTTLLTGAASWLAVCERLRLPCVDPSVMLRDALNDPRSAMLFLSRWYLPPRHGGTFGRYPAQLGFVRRWFEERRGEWLSILDTACGTGEGVYDLALVAAASGFPPSRVMIVGETLSAVEVVSAASGVIPHDPGRTARFVPVRQRVLQSGMLERIIFRQHDLLADQGGDGRHDLILCNGLMGGPVLHDPDLMGQVIDTLARRLRRRGILLIADRFHEGRHRQGGRLVRQVLEQAGFSLIDPGEGIGGVISSG